MQCYIIDDETGLHVHFNILISDQEQKPIVALPLMKLGQLH